MEIPGLGSVEADDETYISHPVTVPVLDYNEVEFFVEGYDDDDAPEDFHDAIEAFLALDESALQAASKTVFAYYEDVRAAFEADGPHEQVDPDDDPAEIVDIAGPDDVWEHVQLGVEATIAREADGDEVCVTVQCGCDWDRERGLLLEFRGGREVSKAGPGEG
ncbi:DUF6985 domain-containing protein [Catenulispora subtropica]|uniref:DUF6985 domain-containing protein n=1 Tax=Catenulispora subtropica TaxID=450798 RepID=A0ABN2RGI0_9ACTN